MQLLRRLSGLFERYCMAHGRVHGRPMPVKNAQGDQIGRLEELWYDRDRITVRGIAEVSDARLRSEAGEVSVSLPEGSTGSLRFDLTLPRNELLGGTEDDPDASPKVELGLDKQRLVLRFPRAALVRAQLLGGFAWGMLKLVPAFASWAMTGDPRDRAQVKRVLGLDLQSHFGPLDPQVLTPLPQPADAGVAIMPARVTILIPVHNGFELLEDCLGRVLAHTDLPWRMILIEDASTDPRVRPFLREWTAARLTEGKSVELIEADINLGFIGAVNTGFKSARGSDGTFEGPLVLLNSDALVPEGWTSRLVAPLSDPLVASVTPMSNDAEITNVPVICRRQDIPTGLGDRLDRVASRLSPERVLAEMPTGVGFCMGLAAGFLARLPEFDTSFGRGYGEEVDWCQKARALGGRHVGIANLFVEHRGGASFGSAEKQTLILRNNALIAQRYPTYDREVQRFIQSDPLRSARLVLALSWAGNVAQDERIPVYLAHSLGGGADIWLQHKIEADLKQGRPSVVLRVGGPLRWQIELHTAGGVTGGLTGDEALMRDLLDFLPHRTVIYSCGVGDPDPVEIPDLLCSLLRPGDRLEVLLHDWLPISPSYTLLDADGCYRGPVGPGRTDPAHIARRPSGHRLSLQEWQAAWGRMMRAADLITVFAEDGRKQLAGAWPDLPSGKVVLRPHGLRPNLEFAVTTQTAPVAGEHVLGIIGNLNRHKGAGVVARLGRHIGRDLAGIVVLGQVDPACALPRKVKIHGGYSIEEIPALAARYGISHWLVPAIWPETFSFATHEALATGLPVLAFDLGAQGGAVRAAGNGRIVPLKDENTGAEAVLDALKEAADAA